MPYADPEVRRAYQRGWQARRRQEWFAANGPCVDCGTWDGLELDHVNAATKVSHRVWTWSRERREAELAKCVARCKQCHRIKSLAYDNPNYINGFRHGSRSMYQKHGCRCPECTAWQSARMKRYRSRPPSSVGRAPQW